MFRKFYLYLIALLSFAISCQHKEVAKQAIQSSSAPNVEVLKDSFAVDNGKGEPIYRKIWLYLPPNYNEKSESFPVIYMHDGQNLFDDKTSYIGDWKVDETLNQLFKETQKGFIVVGIENTGAERMNEYSPWQHEKYGGGSGDRYLNMIIYELKPFIDLNYRTLPNRDHTAIIGSSMGGLISYYAGLKHPSVFGKAGALSTSFWFSDEVMSFTQNNGKLENSKLFLLAGGKEGGNMDKDMITVKNLLLQSGFPEDLLAAKIVPSGEHNEKFWSGELKEVITWLFDIE